MHVPDSIMLGLVGPFGVGKSTLCAAIQDPRFKQHLLGSIRRGNYWVPDEVTVSDEGRDDKLFDRYSANPKKYGFEFQVFQDPDRFFRQRRAANTSGVSIVDMPLCAGRWGYAEANRANMGDSFATYEQLYSALESSVRHPDAYIYLRVREDQVDVILDRIRKRGRSNERKFLDDPSYIINLIRLWEDFHTKVKEPVIPIDASKINLEGELDKQYVAQTLEYIGSEVRKMRAPPHLTLEEWCRVEFTQAMRATNEARQQLSNYLHQRQLVISLLGNVGVGKTSCAEMLSGNLGISIVRELKGANTGISDENRLLSLFLQDKNRYCFALQEALAGKRYASRIEACRGGESVVEDRSPEEDAEVFHRRFEDQGYLTSRQRHTLLGRLQRSSKQAPQADLWVVLDDTPGRCRKRIERRGRFEEMKAWSLSELRELGKLYQNIIDNSKNDRLYSGPAVRLDVGKVDFRYAVHHGYVFQEIHHALLQSRERR